jgi:hypothetical protein
LSFSISPDQSPVGIFHELDGAFGHTRSGYCLLHQFDQCQIGIESFFAAAQNHGIAGFQAQRGNIDQ